MTELERRACKLALKSIRDWLDSDLPRPLADTLKEIDLALAVMEDRGWPDVMPILGKNWASRFARRSLTTKQYADAQLAAYALRIGVSKEFVTAWLGAVELAA